MPKVKKEKISPRGAGVRKYKIEPQRRRGGEVLA